MPHTSRIQVRTYQPDIYRSLADSGIPPLLAKLMAARNIGNPSELDDKFSLLLPYTDLKNCEAAAERLADAVTHREKIWIVADYDADGASACAVAVKGLSAMGATVDFFVPNRFEHGYGLTAELSETAHRSGAQLIVTVDNGIASLEGVARARALGLDVIVTDHHLPASELPDCIIVNPNQPGCTFKSKNLAGVGVIFYVLTALRAALRRRHYFSGSLPEPNLADLLDLVALGTIADVVPLDHNNRILVSQGLKRIRAGKINHGIRALFEVSRSEVHKARPFDIGFKIGPRINAAGRLDDMSVGIACLLSGSLEEARQTASDLNALNQTRQSIEQGMLQQALAHCPDTLDQQQTTLSIYHSEFHQGVVGIVASRLKEKFYRPTFIFAPSDNGEIRGSGRSVQGIHLRDILDTVSKRHPDLLLKFGGHAMAAGVTLKAKDFELFRQCFEQVVAETADLSALSPVYLTDGSLNTEDITLEHAALLERQIWGQGFPSPSFCDEFSVILQQSMGYEGKHIKALLEKDDSRFEAVFWNCTEQLPERIRTVYRPVANEWRNQLELQLYVDYWEAV